ncbi:MAG: class I SAM-dependent methyltransferase [Chloroflexi bacterium]|nr:MAG: class I SAM-dependent methyltransferase [Chloroflexota bacterium]
MSHADAHGRDGGAHVGHGHGQHSMAGGLMHALFFGGRRRRGYTRLVIASGIHPGDRLLDVGCGTGYLTRLVADAAAPDGTALGIDPSLQALERARRSRRPTNCSFAVGTAEALDATEGAFDVVVSSLAIHHIPEGARSTAFAEMFRVLRPGGRLLVADFRPPRSRVVRWLIRSFVSGAMLTNPVDLLEPLVRGAGFEDVSHGHVRPWFRYVLGAKPRAAEPIDRRAHRPSAE